MKKQCKNIFDAWVTSLFGIAVLALTLLFWYNERITLIWEGVIGFAVGTTLLMAPRTIEKHIGNAIKYIGGRGGDDDDDIPPNPPREI